MSLSDTQLRNMKATGKAKKISDGGGLYLHLSPAGGKLWRMAYRFEGKQKTVCFGAYPAVSLKEAREKRDESKALLASVASTKLIHIKRSTVFPCRST